MGEFIGAKLPNRPVTGVSNFAGNERTSNQSSLDSDDDLWLWMMTDIPTSFRTLMLDSFHHDSSNSHSTTASLSQGNGDFAGAGASGDFEPLSGNVCEEGGATPIATDDRLGAYS